MSFWVDFWAGRHPHREMDEAPTNAEPDAPLRERDPQTWRRRYRLAREAGMTIVEAEIFADSEEVKSVKLKALMARGCPPEYLARILL